MTDDRPGIPGEPDFDDPAHAPISDLLASARVDSPIPTDVAARLDATLAELTGRPRAAGGEHEPVATPVVVPLRRRSRLAPRLLAAAAVVAVAGAGAVGVSQVLQDTRGSADSAKAGGATAADSGSLSSPEVAVPGTAPSPVDGLAGVKSLQSGALTVPVLTTADFATQTLDLDLKTLSPLERAARLADQSFSYADRSPLPTHGGNLSGSGDGAAPATPPPAADSAGPQTGTMADLRATAAQARGCTPPKIDGIASYPIVFDGQAALLVVHRENSGTQLVQAWTCDGTEVLAFTTVPA